MHYFLIVHGVKHVSYHQSFTTAVGELNAVVFHEVSQAYGQTAGVECIPFEKRANDGN